MADESIIVKRQGTIFLAGTAVVKATTCEEVSADDLGGADLHCKTSGIADHYTVDDEHAILWRDKLFVRYCRSESDEKVRYSRRYCPKLYGDTLVCGFAQFYGHRVGIFGTNGVLFSESALQGAHFI
ncbi:hypothetical protein GQX74_006030 [Glossina fuscipes]|nr:hypothetical protein GQX74_006030 [Glossina fuscipes]